MKNHSPSKNHAKTLKVNEENEEKPYIPPIHRQEVNHILIQNLLKKRTNLLSKIASIQLEQEIIDKIELNGLEDKQSFEKERGGDISLIKLSEKELRSVNSRVLGATDDIVKGNFKNKFKLMKEHVVYDTRSNDQILRRTERLELKKKKAGKLLKDAQAFDEKRGGRPKDENIGNALNEEIISEIWQKLPQGDDGLCDLDIDLLEDIFEAAGIILNDQDATELLKFIPSNQLNKYSLKDVLVFCNMYFTRGSPSSLSCWNKFVYVFNNLYNSCRKLYTDVIKGLNTQRKLVDQLRLSQPKFNMNFRGDIKDIDEGRVTANNSVLGEMKGSVRLAAWQKNQILNQPTSLNFYSVFGKALISLNERKALNKSEKSKADQSKNEAVGISTASLIENMKQMAKKAQEESEEADDQWKSTINIDVNIKPTDDRRIKPIKVGSDKLIGTLSDICPLDLLERYKYKKKGLVQDRLEQYESIIWFAIDVKEGSTTGQITLLMQTIKNIFECIDYDTRCNLYTAVEAEIFYFTSTFDDNDEDDDSETGENAQLFDESDCVIIVSLLHEEDHFRNLEESLPAGLLVSRTLRAFSLQFKCTDTLVDLYKLSTPFEHYTTRLFGPQEDELGDEGMNPLRFAKMCKQRKNAALEAYEKAEKMTMDKLKDQLRIRGLDITGTKSDLVERVKAALKRQADTIGFGELSAFGADIVKRIYSSFCKVGDNTKTMSLWEMNRFLDSMSVGTLYNADEFNHMLKQHSLLANDGCLTEEGLIAYYERYGHLAQDMESLGYGSLDDLINGEINISIDYDTEGLVTLLDLMESHSLRNPYFKQIICILSSIDKIAAEFVNCTLSDFIIKIMEQILPSDSAKPPPTFSSKDFVSYFKRVFSTPGLISRAINTFVEWLSDGNDGIIRDLRLLVVKEFGKFDNWEDVFKESFPKQIVGTSKNNLSTSEASQNTEDIFNKIKAILPALLESKINNETNRKSLKEKVNYVNEIIQKSDILRLKVAEIEALKRYRNKLLDQDDFMSKVIKERQKLALVHLIAGYDAFRMYAVGIGSIGIGGKELTARICCNGFNFTDFLPKAFGEPCIVKERQQEKYNRSISRKETALNALANEKRKTTTDPVELEKIRILKEEEMKKKRNDDENKLLNEALRGMLDAREERKSIEDLNKLIVLWERLSIAKNNKYGKDHIVSIICRNNLACVNLEFIGMAIKSNEIISTMTGCVDSIILLLSAYDVHFLSSINTANPISRSPGRTNDNNNTNVIHTEEINAINNPPLDLELIAPCVTILQNFITIVKIRYAGNLNEIMYKQRDKVVTLYELFCQLGEKEQKMVSLGKCRAMENIPVLTAENFIKQFEITINDMKQEKESLIIDSGQDLIKIIDYNNDGDFSIVGDGSIGQVSQLSPGSASIASDMKSEYLKEEQSLHIGGLNDTNEDNNEIDTLDTARLKQIKYEKQKEDDKKLRAKVTRERNKLYSLIQSDKISEIFAETAGGAVPTGKNIKWGASSSSVNNSVSSDPFEFLDGNNSNQYFAGSTIDQTSTISYENSLENSSIALSLSTNKGKSINDIPNNVPKQKKAQIKVVSATDPDNGDTNPKKISYKDKKVLPPKTMLEWIKDKLDL